MIIKAIEHTSRKVEVDVEPMAALDSLRAHTLATLGVSASAYISTKGYLVKDHPNMHGSVDELLISETPSHQIVATLLALNHIYSVIIRD
jgi:hypothetical protein